MKMKRRIAALAMCMAMIAPSILASAQESIPVLGEWKISGMMGLKFEPAYESMQTYSSKNSFMLKYPEGIRARLSAIVVTTGAFVYKGNDTANATQVLPDSAGVYTLELPETGEYTLVFASVSALSSIPVLGSVCSSLAQSSRTEIKITYMRNWAPAIMIILVVAIGGLIAVVVYSLYARRRRKRAEEVEAR